MTEKRFFILILTFVLKGTLAGAQYAVPFKKRSSLILPERATGMMVLRQLDSPDPCTLQRRRGLACSDDRIQAHPYEGNPSQYTIDRLPARTKYYCTISCGFYQRTGRFVAAPAETAQDLFRLILYRAFR